MKPKVLLSVVIPAYNEADCISELGRQLAILFEIEVKYDWECIIIDNGSSDNTWAELQKLSPLISNLRLIRLSRNFKMEGGLAAGLSSATGDACVFMAADLQDPPAMISDFIRKWEAGYQNIYGIVSSRKGSSILRRVNSRLYYWLISNLTGNQIPRNASDFRLMDRQVYEAVRDLPERGRFARGLVAWVGFKAIGIKFDRPERFKGESKAGTSLVVNLALKGIFSNSLFPLRLITIIGITCSITAILGLFGAVILWYSRGIPFAGFGTLVGLVLLPFGILSFMLGIISEYLGLVYEEVKARPTYIISETKQL